MADDEPPFDPATFQGVMLTNQRVTCPVHISPFKSEWPKGYTIFMVKSFTHVTAVDGVWAKARELAGLAPGEDVPVKALELVFDVRPICCRLPARVLASIYEECGIGCVKRCKVCGSKRLGTPISATNVSYGHVCFPCISTASTTPQDVS